eukprot:m.448633 g.448633  ORF g.448633 m.448633 type:complete len:66 (+) comp56892_c1_seq3:2052-2249(+)
MTLTERLQGFTVAYLRQVVLPVASDRAETSKMPTAQANSETLAVRLARVLANANTCTGSAQEQAS